MIRFKWVVKFSKIKKWGCVSINGFNTMYDSSIE